MMRLPLLLFMLAVTAVLTHSCGSKAGPDDRAAIAAKEYYEHLIAGRYDEYLAGLSGADSIPAGYREQLIANARQFADIQQREHSGISSVQILRYTADSLTAQTNVFLLLCFGDSTREEIVVPMVERAGRWLMR